MRVISMVPSLTETLLECGVNVVGRTRFCIHPKDYVSSIAVVGGTKDIDWKKVADLKADLLILDQEENPKAFADESILPFFASHIHDLSSLADALAELGRTLKNEKLEALSLKARAAARIHKTWSFEKIPGEIQKLRRDFNSYSELVYVIWKNPWMQVSRDTFIGSVISHFGFEIKTISQKYPEFRIEDFDLQKTYFLFSSEPFPFAKKVEDLLKIDGLQGSIVDGEIYSWFGSRTLRAL